MLVAWSVVPDLNNDAGCVPAAGAFPLIGSHNPLRLISAVT